MVKPSSPESSISWPWKAPSTCCVCKYLHIFLFRVAVPVLVKDGKPCSGSESSDADTGQGLSSHTNHHPVKSEYTLPESSTGLGEVMEPPSHTGSLPPLMHMGYAVSRHSSHQNLLQQAGMCSYGQHKAGW